MNCTIMFVGHRGKVRMVEDKSTEDTKLLVTDDREKESKLI